MSNPYNERFSPYDTLSLEDQLFLESRAMAEHAISNGIKVPAESIKTIEKFVKYFENKGAMPLPPPSEKEPEKKGEIKIQGTPQELPMSIEKLVEVHDNLAELIKPATPKTILLIDMEAAKAGFWAFLGPVTLVRRMMGVAIVSFILFILFALSPDVNSSGGAILEDSGISLLLNLLFFIAAAAVGASFYGLYKAGRYIEEGTFDPKYEASYWIRFSLGLISGIILATVIPIEGASMGKPVLAMLGGFSSDLVYRILNRLVETIGSLFPPAGS